MEFELKNVNTVTIELEVNIKLFFKQLQLYSRLHFFLKTSSRNMICMRKLLFYLFILMLSTRWVLDNLTLITFLYKYQVIFCLIEQVRKADPNIMVAQNWIKRHLSYNRDGTPKHSHWLATKVARSLDFLLELSVHTWLYDILHFPVLITHQGEASG